MANMGAPAWRPTAVSGWPPSGRLLLQPAAKAAALTGGSRHVAARHGAAVRSCPRPSSVRWAGPRPLPAALRSTASGAYSFVQTPWGWASDSYSENSELEFQAAGMPLEVLKCPNGQCGVTTFYVLGTAHVSKQSCRDAQSLIRRLRPDVVFLELCRERERDCLEDAEQEAEPFSWRKAREAGVPFGMALIMWFLSGTLVIQDALGIKAGSEMRAASQEAVAVGAQVVLGDRPVTVTLARAHNALSLWEALKLLVQMAMALLLLNPLTMFIAAGLAFAGLSGVLRALAVPPTVRFTAALLLLVALPLCVVAWLERLESSVGSEQATGLSKEFSLEDFIEKLKEKDKLAEGAAAFHNLFPSLARVLVDERDAYMVCVLRSLAKEAQTVVAVVGAAHLQGIREKWDAEIDVHEIAALPNKMSPWLWQCVANWQSLQANAATTRAEQLEARLAEVEDYFKMLEPAPWRPRERESSTDRVSQLAGRVRELKQKLSSAEGRWQEERERAEALEERVAELEAQLREVQAAR